MQAAKEGSSNISCYLVCDTPNFVLLIKITFVEASAAFCAARGPQVD